MSAALRVHVAHRMNGASCTRDITCALSNIRRPMSMRELRLMTFERWTNQEIAAALDKHIKRGNVVKSRENGLAAFTYQWVL